MPVITRKPPTVLKKSCRCRSTSSGPRIVRKTIRRPEGWDVLFQLARIACDQCDSPWKPQQVKV